MVDVTKVGKEILHLERPFVGERKLGARAHDRANSRVGDGPDVRCAAQHRQKPARGWTESHGGARSDVGDGRAAGDEDQETICRGEANAPADGREPVGPRRRAVGLRSNPERRVDTADGRGGGAARPAMTDKINVRLAAEHELTDLAIAANLHADYAAAGVARAETLC